MLTWVLLNGEHRKNYSKYFEWLKADIFINIGDFMKNLILIAMTLSTLYSTAAFAKSKGAGSSGGGDICEDRIKTIRSDLREWINKGGPKSLKLPAGLLLEQYSENMLEKINNANIKCVGEDDQDYPVTINGTPKTCRFDLYDKASRITCDYKKFASLSETEQYVLIHHEYAGLAFVEIPNGDDSVYDVSNQLSKYLVNVVSKKLAVTPMDEGTPIRLVALPQGSVIRIPVNYIVNAGDVNMIMPELNLNSSGSLQCFLGFNRSLKSRLLKGVVELRVLYVEFKKSIGRESWFEFYTTNEKINEKQVEFKLNCRHRNDRLSIQDMNLYFQNLGGAVTVSPTVDF